MDRSDSSAVDSRIAYAASGIPLSRHKKSDASGDIHRTVKSRRRGAFISAIQPYLAGFTSVTPWSSDVHLGALLYCLLRSNRSDLGPV